MEYALGLDPVGTSSDLAAIRPKGGTAQEAGTNYFTLTYRVDPLKTELAYEPELSLTLHPPNWQLVEARGRIAQDGALEVWQARAPMKSMQALFRLAIVKQQ